MTATDGSDAILLMLTGVTVVIITLRLMVRAHRNKQKAIKQQYSARSRATPGNATPACQGSGRSAQLTGADEREDRGQTVGQVDEPVQ